MERTRSNLLTFFTAFSNTEEVSTKMSKLASLKKKDYINAGVTEEEIEELTASSSKMKKFVDKILKGKKEKNCENELVKKYGEAKKGNPIFDQGQRMNEIEGRTRDE